MLNLQVVQPSVIGDSLVCIYWPLATTQLNLARYLVCAGENVRAPVLYVICTHFDEAHPLALPLVDVCRLRWSCLVLLGS
jgi:hypothetical protein